MAAPSAVVYLLVPLILWRIYARIRRNIGRQRSRAWRHWFGVVFFPLLALLLASSAITRPLSEAALGTGFAGGALLAVAALRLTKYERTEQGFFYTPNAYIGVALSLLLVSRILYRALQLYGVDAAAVAGTNAEFGRSPLTLGMIGLVAGYYALFAAGLLRWRSRAAPVVAAPND